MTADEAIARLLDARGVLREDARVSPPSSAYLVFSQRPNAGLDVAGLRTTAERFFGTTVGLMVPKRYERDWPSTDVAQIVVAPSSIAGGTRFVFGRPVDEADFAAADEADLRAGRAGMIELARRCPTTWHVERLSAEDPTALLVAAIFSTTFLGPIFDGESLFAVRTARARLERAASAYR